jgi:hypothetical protein
MAIPESQLDTWSHQGSITQSKDTYATVKNALEHSGASYADKSFKVFLQGSYGNDTNIFAESDVDIVIRLDSIYHGDVSALPSDQLAAYQRSFSPATYTFEEFKRGVITRLTNAFGATAVLPGNKAIKIQPNGSRRSADVVVCYEHRRYSRYISQYDQEYVSGIIFPTSSSGNVINYPTKHSDNCSAHHQATNCWFKPMVRIVKNMRSRLVNDGKITRDLAPSYYIEGMLFNVPKEKFGGSYSATFVNCLNWLLQADRSKLVCANWEYYLLGNSNVQWTTEQYERFLNELVSLWNSW